MKITFPSFLLFFYCVLASCGTDVVAHENTSTNGNGYLSVKSVVDGDTFLLEDGSAKGLKVRLIGIDAPESRNSFKKKKQYFGKEAGDYLENLLKNKKVRLEYDVTRLDQYKRTLAYAWLPDGTMINAHLVENGYAMVMTIPPNIKYADEFYKLQQQAREKRKGLWRANR